MMFDCNLKSSPGPTEKYGPMGGWPVLTLSLFGSTAAFREEEPGEEGEVGRVFYHCSFYPQG